MHTPPRLRVQHRGLREAHRRLPRGRRHASACRACSSATRPARTCCSRSRSARRSACSASGRRPESLAAAIARYRPTIVTNVPTMLGKLLDLDDERRATRRAAASTSSSVRFHLSAGEALPEPLLRAVHRALRRPRSTTASARRRCSTSTARTAPATSSPARSAASSRATRSRSFPRTPTAPGAPPLPPGEIGVLWVKGDRSRSATSRIATRAGRRSTATGAAPAICSASTSAATCGSAGAPTICSRSAASSSRRARSRTACSRTARVSVAAVIAAEDAGLTKPKAFVVLRPEARARIATPEGKRALAAELKAHVQARLSQAQVSALGRVRRRSAEERSRQGRQEDC